MQDVIIGMAGTGGDGVISAGEALISVAAGSGHYAMMTKSFGSQIRGGESSFRLRIATAPVLSSGGALDIAVALDWDDFLRFGSELPVDGRTTVIHDADPDLPPAPLPLLGVTPAEIVAVPLLRIARRVAGDDKARNSVVLGLLSVWCGLPGEPLVRALKRRFAGKGDDLADRNEQAFHAGVAHAAAHPLRTDRTLAPSSGGEMLLADGNSMCAAGALFAGCTFFGGYPITPSTEIMQMLGREIWKYGGTLFQAEDEIAGIGAVVGASFAGRKAMTATSGPGMSLKAEMLGLATIAELPLVCVNVQRGGPSTGIPTKSEQSDLLQAAFSAHGDVARPVLAPTSVADTFITTVEAFNIAEQFQTPVVVLSDQDIAQRKEACAPLDLSRLTVVDRRRPTAKELEQYARFLVTDSGVSPISEPGLEGGAYLASGIEHDARGAPTAVGEIHVRMNDKRFRKLNPLKGRTDLFDVYGPPDAPIGLIAWGSVAGCAREALDLARQEHIRAKLLVPRLLYPVSEAIYQDFFGSIRRGLVIEQSHQGQLYRLVRMFVDVPPGVTQLARSGSNPFEPVEILSRIRDLAHAFQRECVCEPAMG